MTALERIHLAPPPFTELLHGPVAVVDDDPSMRALIKRWLEEEGYGVIEHPHGREVLEQRDVDPVAICLDLGLDDINGMDVLRHMQARDPSLPIIVVTAQNELETAVSAMRSGAYDFLTKPLDRERFKHAVRRAVERRELTLSVQRLEHELSERYLLRSIVGRSSSMRELARQVERVLDSDVAVAISGESGTGKELVARAIHNNGRRKKGPFVAVNCAAIPDSLHESELFGHEKGAFTGAVAAHRGRFEQAEGGTLFLDEIGEMDPATQASLLRALQERTIRRVGGSAEIPIDVRIICATNRDLANEVRAGRFREDLYFRLIVYPLAIPSLRDRRDDIPQLVAHFLRKYKDDVGRELQRVSSDALEALAQYGWPGNVRELENVVHRAMLACDGDEISLGHLPPAVREKVLPSVPAKPMNGSAPVNGEDDNTVVPLKELEKRAIDKALKASGGSVGKAAKLLGMGRATLYRRIAELGKAASAKAEAPPQP